MPLEKESLNNFLPNGFETLNQEGYKENFNEDKIATGFERDVPDIVSGPNLNNLLDNIGKNTNVLTKFMDFIKNMPINNLFAVDENNQLVYKNLDEVGGGGLEIGDIGIAPLGIDESKGKRRYLNGQIIIQEQFLSFTTKVKEAINLYPTLACSESDWQATALLTVGGQVGKFVVDDDAGTIRLPKIIMPIQGLTDLSKLAEIVEAGLPNITGVIDGQTSGGIPLWTDGGQGAFYNNYTAKDYKALGAASSSITRSSDSALRFDASLSNPIYGNSNTVQQEQIQYPYFIQVATGAETEDNIINEIELNNPYSFGDSKYSSKPLNNLSWLKSEGQWNAKAVYPAYYDWALINANNNLEGFKFVTDEYTDYDVVINTAEETFRLPLLNGSENLVSDKSDTLSISKTDDTYTAPANGFITVSGTTTAESAALGFYNNSIEIIAGRASSNGNIRSFLPMKKGQTVTLYAYYVTVQSARFTYAQGNGSLYFYVGETVQNANLINAGRIEETLANKADKSMVDGQWVSSWFEVYSASSISAVTKTADLTEYLPNDGYDYEVMVRAYLNNNDTYADLSIKTHYNNNNLQAMCSAGSGGRYSRNWGSAVIGKDRTFNYSFSAARSSVTCQIDILAYRRLGTNV